MQRKFSSKKAWLAVLTDKLIEILNFTVWAYSIMFLWAIDIIIDAFERLQTKHNQKSERSNGLASTYIHKDIYINPSYVLKYFFLANPNRRTNFKTAKWFRKVWNVIVIFIFLLLYIFVVIYCYYVSIYFAAICSSFMFLSLRKGSKVLKAAECF